MHVDRNTDVLITIIIGCKLCNNKFNLIKDTFVSLSEEAGSPRHSGWSHLHVRSTNKTHRSHDIGEMRWDIKRILHMWLKTKVTRMKGPQKGTTSETCLPTVCRKEAVVINSPLVIQGRQSWHKSTAHSVRQVLGSSGNASCLLWILTRGSLPLQTAAVDLFDQIILF